MDPTDVMGRGPHPAREPLRPPPRQPRIRRRTNNVEFESAALRIRTVLCRAGANDCADVEYSSTHTLVLPQSGIFIKHEAPHPAVAADSTHGIFFTANRPYQVSHPTSGGDDCLVVEYSRDALFDLMQMLDPPASETPEAPFRVPAVRLDPGSILRRRVLWHRLTRRLATSLEVEETAFALFAAALAAGRGRASARGRPRREAAHHAEIVRATQITIAERPEERWSLETLARRVHSSPFHLARLFRGHVGLPIHQYQLLTRLTRALDSVLDSRRTLSAIGVEAGFAHHSHFSGAFRRVFHVTPSALRRRGTVSRASDLRKILTASRPPEE